MSLNYKVKDDVMIIQYQSTIENDTVENLKRELVHIIDQENPKKVIFDFKDTRFVDTCGVGMFLFLQMHYHKAVHFRMCHLQPAIEELFVQANLLKNFKIDQSLKASLEAMP